jgi:outer membrane scaffolding protein for murein synthesis (MipA/OmpV family)
MHKIMAKIASPIAAALALLASGTTVHAQAAPAGDAAQGTAYDGDWLSVGIGAGITPSYVGSDDYVFTPVPLVQGNLFGIGITPRPAGIALDFIPNPDHGIGFSLGPAVRVRSNRATDPKDPVVALLPRLAHTVEVGPTFGFSVPHVLDPYDSLSFSTDVRWDVTGHYSGAVIDPTISYFTPVSRGAAVSLAIDAEHNSDSFMNYYYSIGPADSAASGLPQFQARGGWKRVGALILGGIDLDGDLANGGFAIFAVAGYDRLLGDAADSPVTSIRGSPNQWLGAVGIGYTF